jgi:hypothetical protein
MIKWSLHLSIALLDGEIDGQLRFSKQKCSNSTGLSTGQFSSSLATTFQNPRRPKQLLEFVLFDASSRIVPSSSRCKARRCMRKDNRGAVAVLIAAIQWPI